MSRDRVDHGLVLVYLPAGDIQCRDGARRDTGSAALAGNRVHVGPLLDHAFLDFHILKRDRAGVVTSVEAEAAAVAERRVDLGHEWLHLDVIHSQQGGHLGRRGRCGRRALGDVHRRLNRAGEEQARNGALDRPKLRMDLQEEPV